MTAALMADKKLYKFKNNKMITKENLQIESEKKKSLQQEQKNPLKNSSSALHCYTQSTCLEKRNQCNRMFTDTSEN